MIFHFASFSWFRLVSRCLLVSRRNRTAWRWSWLLSHTIWKFRVYVEYWHLLLINSLTESGTVQIRYNTSAVVPISITENTPDGLLRNVDRGSLPGCGSPSTETPVTVCSNSPSFNNWVYFDYSTQYNVLMNVTVLEGTTQVLEQCCPDNVYPATITEAFSDAVTPVMSVSDVLCECGIGLTINLFLIVALTRVMIAIQIQPLLLLTVLKCLVFCYQISR